MVIARSPNAIGTTKQYRFKAYIISIAFPHKILSFPLRGVRSERGASPSQYYPLSDQSNVTVSMILQVGEG
jgi:hypothetical protein